VTDKGCDAKANREAARERGICPVIPYRSNAADRPAFFPKALYRGRTRIEQPIGKLKRFKRIALRCEKTAENYAALVSFASGLVLVKSVRTAKCNTPVMGRGSYRFGDYLRLGLPASPTVLAVGVHAIALVVRGRQR